MAAWSTADTLDRDFLLVVFEFFDDDRLLGLLLLSPEAERELLERRLSLGCTTLVGTKSDVPPSEDNPSSSEVEGLSYGFSSELLPAIWPSGKERFLALPRLFFLFGSLVAPGDREEGNPATVFRRDVDGESSEDIAQL